MSSVPAMTPACLRMQVHGALLQQVFGLCEQLVMLHASITEFLQHLQAGGFIQCTLDTLLLVRRVCFCLPPLAPPSPLSTLTGCTFCFVQPLLQLPFITVQYSDRTVPECAVSVFNLSRLPDQC